MMECLPFFLSNPGTQYSKSGEGDLKKGKADHKKGERQVKTTKTQIDQCRLITEGRSDIQDDSSASVNEQLSYRFWNCKRSKGVTPKKKFEGNRQPHKFQHKFFKKLKNCGSSLQETTKILQDIELSRLYLSTRSSWQPATNIQWSCTAKPVQTNGCKSQIDAKNRQQSKESSLHLHNRKEKLSSYSDGLLNIQIAEETKPQIHSCFSQDKKDQIKTHSLTLHD
jgi:hypothetical protein